MKQQQHSDIRLVLARLKSEKRRFALMALAYRNSLGHCRFCACHGVLLDVEMSYSGAGNFL